MAQITNNTIQISPEVLSQEVDGETVLLDLASECYFGLDEVGTRIWQELQGEKDLGEIIKTILEEFDVERETVESDLDRLIGELNDAGLISIE